MHKRQHVRSSSHHSLSLIFFVHARKNKKQKLGFKTSCFGLTSCGYVLIMSHSQSFCGAGLLNSLKLNSNFFFLLRRFYLHYRWEFGRTRCHRGLAPSSRHLSSTFKGLGVCMGTSALSARL